MNILRVMTLGAVLLLFAALAAPPARADVFTYDIWDHPNGGVKPPLYSLRLDGLYDFDSSKEWTFSSTAMGADLMLIVDTGASTIRIMGTVYGGLDTGTTWGDPTRVGTWDVDFLYTANVAVLSDGYRVNGESAANNGTITPKFDVGGDSSKNGVPISLVDEQGSKSYSFSFRDTDNNGIFGGLGWLNHSGRSHIYASDWKFLGALKPPGSAPEPALALLFLAGGAFIVHRRRK